MDARFADDQEGRSSPLTIFAEGCTQVITEPCGPSRPSPRRRRGGDREIELYLRVPVAHVSAVLLLALLSVLFAR
jgi:hypothetical protein